MKILWLFFLLISVPLYSWANNDKVVNVYIWSNEVPDSVIHKFEEETGITVNYSNYDSNETLYAKLKANPHAGYDVIEPSSYYVQRMSREGMLQKLDKSKLPNYKNLDPLFLNRPFDPTSSYSIPFLWGVTGIFVNKTFFQPDQITKWSDFWDPKYKNQLLMLNDVREVFSMAFLSLGFSANTNNPTEIKQAYEKLITLLPNIKLFNNDAVPSIVSDDDATIGMVWNGDFYKAAMENENLAFVYPKDGFVIWVDCFAIPQYAPHVENAHIFINYLMRPDVALQAMIEDKYSVANLAGQALLPANLRSNTAIYPLKSILERGEFQTDISDEALGLYQTYWQLLKAQA